MWNDPIAVVRCTFGNEGRLKCKTTGGDAEQTYKHRARSAGRSGNCVVTNLCTSNSHVHRAAGLLDPGVPRALVFEGSLSAIARRATAEGRKTLLECGLPGADKERGR